MNFNSFTEVRKEVEKIKGFYTVDVFDKYIPFFTDPSDYLDLIEEIKPDLLRPVFDSDGNYVCTEWEATEMTYEADPVHAAMIVFIKVNGGKE